jgi:regulator of protease activity HflC (stomatin/prohibitin superfamily)
MALKGDWDPPPNYHQAQKEVQQLKERAKRQEEERAKQQAQAKAEYRAKARTGRLLAYYQGLESDKKHEIDQRAEANLNNFVKGLVKELIEAGKDPMESPMYKINFEQERIKILAETRRGPQPKENG